MFKNIGKKIKGLAKFLFWFGFVLIILSVFVAIIGSFISALAWGEEEAVLMAFGSFFGSIIGGVVLFLLLWISLWGLYAFGELVDNSAIIAKAATENKETPVVRVAPPAAPAVPTPAEVPAEAPTTL